jgi:ABC-type glycerol-3-phosphate transport system substrate-binding protein
MDRQSSKKPISRRDFLRQAGILAGAAALASCASPTPKVIKETVEVEKVVTQEVVKEVEKVVTQEVVVEVTAAPKALEPATLNIWINWTGSYQQAIEQISAGFVARHPGMEVEILPGIGGTEGVTKFLASLAGGNPPDLFNGHADDGYMFTSRGAVQPLDDYLATSRVSKDDFFEAQLNRYLYDGKIHGIPSIEGAAGQAIFWNKAQFEEVGLDPEVGPSTHAELREWADRLEIFDDAGNIVRLGFHPRDGRGWSAIDWWFDRNWYDVENHKVHLDSENMIKGCDWIVGFYHHVGPEKFTSFRQTYKTSIKAGSGFVSKAQSMLMGAYYHCRALANLETDIELGLGWVPTFDGKKVTTMRGWFWMMPVGCPHPDQTWQYIEEFTTVDAAFTLFNVTGGWPSYKPFLEAAKFEWEKIPGLQWMINSPDAADEIHMNPPFPISLDEVDDRINAGLDEMAFDPSLTAEAMLTEVSAEIQKLVDQAIRATG